MTKQDFLHTENEIIRDMIHRGQFRNAQQGMRVGEWIVEGLVKGWTQPIKIPIELEGNE